MRDAVVALLAILVGTLLSQTGSAVLASLGVAVMLAAPLVWLVKELGRTES